MLPWRQSSIQCGVENIVADVQDPTQRYFPWSETIQGHILGAYYYGYILTNINGGQLADKFGPRWMCGIITLISSLLTLLTPLVAEMDEIMLILLRIGTGLCQAFSPRRSTHSLIQVGGYAGAVMTTILSGILSSTVGWKWVFYVFGCFGIFCFFVWMYVIYNTPAEHPRILEEELIKIKMTVNVSAIASTNKANRPPVPWRAIWLSVPVWSISIAKFCGAWGNLMLMSKLPSYLKSILHVSITNVSTLPLFTFALVSVEI
ncbi:hypothetical protein RI129_000078 [Pyrocoelia pectoralis]|uniref:Uncharacterized protein n=1 Tax=Pyrocoelia pectoralis TaxID=417401 RepID=A0AAN7V2W1_9COLE